MGTYTNYKCNVARMLNSDIQSQQNSGKDLKSVWVYY